MPTDETRAHHVSPRRGEVWYVNLEPTQGAELQKMRPCVVISADTVGRLPLRLVVPLTTWQEAFAVRPWLALVEPTTENGLVRDSAADTFQLRSVSLLRFDSRGPMGTLSEEVMKQIISALLLTVDAS